MYGLILGGMEIFAEFVYETENKDLYDQMKEKTLVEVEKFEERRKIEMGNSLKKKDFPLFICAEGKYTVQRNLFHPIISAALRK